jgi:hypothetical protein
MNRTAKEVILSEWAGEWAVNKCSANSRRHADTRDQGVSAWDVECYMECVSKAFVCCVWMWMCLYVFPPSYVLCTQGREKRGLRRWWFASCSVWLVLPRCAMTVG